MKDFICNGGVGTARVRDREHNVAAIHAIVNDVKVTKTTKIKIRYNQVPNLTQDTTRESNKKTINITNKSQEVSPFPAGDHKAAMDRRESNTNTRHKNTNDPQKR